MAASAHASSRGGPVGRRALASRLTDDTTCVSYCGSAAGLTATIEYDAGRFPESQYFVTFAFGPFQGRYECSPGRTDCAPRSGTMTASVTMTATRLQVTSGWSQKDTTPLTITITNAVTMHVDTVTRDAVWTAGTEPCTKFCLRATVSARL